MAFPHAAGWTIVSSARKNRASAFSGTEVVGRPGDSSPKETLQWTNSFLQIFANMIKEKRKKNRDRKTTEGNEIKTASSVYHSDYIWITRFMRLLKGIKN